ncbi:hypothetical protein CFC21_013531 [Triticum aestivum]|uniref:Endonuclease/exonuclease/phosphatase domain-containing protein n=2 Tax=Triticum aestivum TaxID=4565 RepID=A0A9R1IYB4_WHEAT|nr:hypothetical protein CFC21_013528 [Triticum aestivum]KAF6997296.1 hypothetical protein CFC21_013531 [Triticum aestivum]
MFAGKTEYLSTGDSKTSLCSKAIKIMTYNVCSGKDYKLHNRILALGDIIRHHSPDLICLQEVTPEIHGFLEKSDWWPEYKCLMSRGMDYTEAGMVCSNTRKPLSKRQKQRSYFCMQMSKLPVDSFDGVPFSDSVMGRELCMANINIGGVTLVLGTSHLESPSRPRLRSNERVAQAKESLILLGGRGSCNLIFCGDMNWDDKTDGPFPLPDGWVDAWAELKPGEDGWTYDTEANAMLSAVVHKRQLRLDRFVCKLPDFEVQGIEMVGKEPIPGVLYVKVDVARWKSKEKICRQRRERMLPVLPSDHFGLVLTVTPQPGSCAPSE